FGEDHGLAAVVRDREISEEIASVAVESPAVEGLVVELFDRKPRAEDGLLLSPRLRPLPRDPHRDLRQVTRNAHAEVGAAGAVLVSLLAGADVGGETDALRDEHDVP